MTEDEAISRHYESMHEDEGDSAPSLCSCGREASEEGVCPRCWLIIDMPPFEEAAE